MIYKHRDLFTAKEIDFWITLDPYSDTVIEVKNIHHLLLFAKKLQEKNLLNELKNSPWFKQIEDGEDYSIKVIKHFAN